MENTEKANRSFAAMNTPEGFKGYFGDIFGETDELYIIKGGPGTGKSRFIKEIGGAAEERGFDTEYFLCSSDTSSMDGVIYTDTKKGCRIGIIDGTSPHSYEPRLPGAKDTVLNFGDLWDASEIRPHKDILKALGEAKNRLYSSVYSYLAAASKLDDIIEGHTLKALDNGKLDRFIDRLFKGITAGNGYKETIRIRTAVSCNGIVSVGYYGKAAKTSYAVLDRSLGANVFMRAIKDRLAALKQPITVSYNPFSPNTPDAIYIPSADMAFYVGSEGAPNEKPINMGRFISDTRLAPYRPKLRATAKLRQELVKMALKDLSCIKGLHAETEEIYISAMDFHKKEKMTKEIIKKLFG